MVGASHEANWDNLYTLTNEVMQQQAVPGVAVGILHQGEIATAGFGVTNVEHSLSVTDETLFQIGSITKTYTGTLMMRLMEMGKVDLDATVRTYIPEFKVVDETASAYATIRHLLTHMVGWSGPPPPNIDTGSGDDALSKYMTRMAELEQLAPLNTVYSYNNSAFQLAGYIIERVTGKGYQTVLKELVLEPLGLNSSFLDPSDVMTHRFAVGHSSGEQGPQVARPWPVPRCAWPAGGIVCHIKDLLRYARFHLGDGSTEDKTRLLSPDSMTQMQSPQVTVWGKETRGLSWQIDEIDGCRRVRHAGSTTGQTALLTLIPERNFAIAVLSNSFEGEVNDKVSQWALKAYLGLEEADPKPIDASPEDLAPYVGRFAIPGRDLELGLLAGRLVWQLTSTYHFPTEDSPIPPPPPPASLALIEKDRLLVMDGPYKGMKLDIVRKADGTIGWLRAGGRIHPRQA